LLYPIHYPRDASFEKVKARLHRIIRYRLQTEAAAKRRAEYGAKYLAEQKEKSDRENAAWEARAFDEDAEDDDSYDH
ncbi:MAG: hypothetical protein JST00_39110, partial [Deltaproteobacteria bacterium]|nr:hypothetical protein [Deltaproteobacteria bacterium]